MNPQLETRYEREFGVPYSAPRRNLASDVHDYLLEQKISGTPFSDTAAWRFVIGQALDDYESRRRWGTLNDAIELFVLEPESTGHAGLDAAIAALPVYLAARDEWEPPAWAMSPRRQTKTPWFVAPSERARRIAQTESPEPFRSRGVFITSDALSRV